MSRPSDLYTNEDDPVLFKGDGVLARSLNWYIEFIQKNESAFGSPWMWRHGYIVYTIFAASYDGNFLLADKNVSVEKSFTVIVVLLCMVWVAVLAVIDIFAAFVMARAITQRKE